MGLFSTSDKTKTSKLKEEGCLVTLQVDVPALKVKEAVHNQILRLRSRARVPGFRAGKAPLDMVQKLYAAAAREHALEDLVRETLFQAFEDHSLRPVGEPSVHSIKMEEGLPLSYQISVEVPPRFKLQGHKKLPVTRKAYPPTEEDVAKQLAELREGNARLERADAEAAGKEHYALIDYETLADGKPVKGPKGSDELVDLSSPHGAEGLPEGLLGAKRGETREVLVKLHGKPAALRVTLKEIKIKILPPLDDEFAKDVGAPSLADLKTRVRELLDEQGKRRAERELAGQLHEGLLKANPFQVPPSLIESALARIYDRLRREMLGPRRDWVDAEKAKILDQLRPRAEEEVRLSYILRSVAEAEKLQVADADVDAEIGRRVQGLAAEGDRAKLKGMLEGGKEEVRAMLLERKVMDFLRDAASVKEG